MKKLIIGLMVGSMALFASCSSAVDKIKSEDEKSAEASVNDATENAGTAAFEFAETEWDFGDIQEGTTVEHVFKFTNSGEAPLIIYNAAGSCGCTVPNWPREAIAPGAEGEIQVKFNSSGRSGVNKKTVTITANTVPNKKMLNITSNVMPKANAGS